MSTKLATLKTLLATLALSAIAFAGCGSSNKTGNVVVVTVSPPGSTNGPLTVIVTQSITFSASVTGTTNTNVTWSCTYATTTFDSSGKPTTGTAQKCDAKTTGNIPDNSTNSTVIFTAPQTIPDPRKITGNNCTDATKTCVLEVTITATSAADPKKTGTSVLVIDSGISVTLKPVTATVPTSADFQFNATLTNDLQSQGVTWLITQGTIDLAKGINYPQLATCDPGCGHITNAGDSGNPPPGRYTAPPTVPTSPTVTLVVTSKADPTRFAIGTITIATAGDITYHSISPLIMPQGATSYDLYVFADGITSASFITFNDPTTDTVLHQFVATDPQLKVLFPIPTSSNTKPTSTGVRIRLGAADLASAQSFVVKVVDPKQKVSVPTGPTQFSVVPVRASSFASAPDSFVQNSSTLSSFLVNGGYFGTSGGLVQALFLGDTKAAISATSRQLNLQFDSAKANAAQPGLYPLSVVRDSTPLPSPNNASVTNFTLFPDYSGTQSAPFSEVSAVTAGVDGTPLTQATAIDVDQETGIAAVATTGQNRVDFFQITAGTLKAIGLSTPVNAPTSVSIDHTLHQVAVVSFQDQTVSVFPLPQPNTSSAVAVPPAATISLQGLVPASSGTSSNPFVPSFPYSIGVDSDTHHALVAYSSSSNPTTARVGFLLDLNSGDTGCLKIASNPTTSPCVSAQVTLTTGRYPQIAMLPHAHMAVVTPGGLGSTAGINVLQTSSSVGIKNVSLTSGLVTVVTTADHGINPVTPGTVLIEGVSVGATSKKDIFNGAFPVLSVIDSTTFTYALAETFNDTATGGTVFFGTPNISIGGLSQTTQGIAINQLTGLVAAADANATGQNGPQINTLNSLDQTFNSITFRTTGTGTGTIGCTFYTSSCAGGLELLGTTSVAFQPFANLLVSYNAPQNQLSVSNPATQQRYAWMQLSPTPTTTQASQSSITVPVNIVGPPPTTSSVTLALNGGLAVDAATNQAVVVNSGTGTVKLVALGPGSPTAIKPVHVTEVLVPSAAPSDPFTQGGVPGANFSQGTLTSATDLTGVKIFGSGFMTGTPQIHLDGVPITTPVPTSDREIDNVTIPASFLAVPHHYALDVTVNGVGSNVSDFFVVKAVDLTSVCKDSTGNSLTKPTSVAIADQLGSGFYAPIAVVTNSGCNNVSVIDIAPQKATFDSTTGAFTGFVDNPPNSTNTAGFGTFFNIPTGSSPSGVAVSPRFGLAVVANNGGGTASVLDLVAKKSALTADVTTGSGPIGVAINEGTGAALVANTAQNTVSEINLGLLFPPPTTPATTPPNTLTATSIGVDTAPIAIAIDPDRGTSNNGLAVVTALALSSSFPRGVLDSVDIGSTTPARSTSAATGSVSLTPTGVVFDPTSTLFYAVSSSGNLVAAFNPDTGTSPSVRVGVNPTSLALNPQTGQILTVNTVTNTISIIDSLSFKTRASFGLPGPPPAGTSLSSLQTNQVAIDQFLNMAVIVDQAHNRVLLFPMPN